jgi:hypothetical protein
MVENRFNNLTNTSVDAHLFRSPSSILELSYKNTYVNQFNMLIPVKAALLPCT